MRSLSGWTKVTKDAHCNEFSHSSSLLYIQLLMVSENPLTYLNIKLEYFNHSCGCEAPIKCHKAHKQAHRAPHV
jgi:hypothetical protein